MVEIALIAKDAKTMLVAKRQAIGRLLRVKNGLEKKRLIKIAHQIGRAHV